MLLPLLADPLLNSQLSALNGFWRGHKTTGTLDMYDVSCLTRGLFRFLIDLVGLLHARTQTISIDGQTHL